MLRLNRGLSSQSMNWTFWSNAKMLLLPSSATEGTPQ